MNNKYLIFGGVIFGGKIFGGGGDSGSTPSSSIIFIYGGNSHTIGIDICGGSATSVDGMYFDCGDASSEN